MQSVHKCCGLPSPGPHRSTCARRDNVTAKKAMAETIKPFVLVCVIAGYNLPVSWGMHSRATALKYLDRVRHHHKDNVQFAYIARKKEM